MATYANTIKSMLFEFPSLFKTRLDCDNYLFAAIGTGYEWKMGQLCYGEDHTIKSLSEYIKEYVDDFLKDNKKNSDKCWPTYFDIRQFKYDIYNDLFIKPLQQLIKSYCFIDDILNNPLSVNDIDHDGFLYPLGRYSKCLEIPDNIKTDWKEALDEFKNFVKDNIDELIKNESLICYDETKKIVASW